MLINHAPARIHALLPPSTINSDPKRPALQEVPGRPNLTAFSTASAIKPPPKRVFNSSLQRNPSEPPAFELSLMGAPQGVTGPSRAAEARHDHNEEVRP
jgi:hypothetical protein